MVSDDKQYSTLLSNPYDIALIGEHLLNCNSLLRKQIETEEDVFIKQNYEISDENRCASKMCASATECVPKRMEENSEGNDSKKHHNAWIKLKSICHQLVSA